SAVGLVEAPVFDVRLGRRGDQCDRTLAALAAAIKVSVRISDGALAHAALFPFHGACLKFKTCPSAVVAVAVDMRSDAHDAAMMVDDFFARVNLLCFERVAVFFNLEAVAA